MELIYSLVQESPAFYTWVFTIISSLCLGFAYFNKQNHDKTLKRLEQDLRYRADRRLKIFDLKASEYSRYVTDLDVFGRKNQTEIPERMQPIIDEYVKRYLAAVETENKELEREAIGWFSSEISALMQEGLKDVLKLKYESNRLKLIATDEMLGTFKKLESLTEESMDHANEFMKSFIDIIANQQQKRIEEYQMKATMLSINMQLQTQILLNQMRAELSEI